MRLITFIRQVLRDCSAFLMYVMRKRRDNFNRKADYITRKKERRKCIEYFFIVILLGQIVPLEARNQDTRCDENIPSRPVPTLSRVIDASGNTKVQTRVCGQGEYLDSSECRPCGDGTFMTRQMSEHGEYFQCLKCYEPGKYEIVAEACTKTRDAKIMCEDGYYRSDVPGKPCQSECAPCDVCGLGSNMFKNYELLECSGTQNSVCCRHENMVVLYGECFYTTEAPKTLSSTATFSAASISATPVCTASISTIPIFATPICTASISTTPISTIPISATPICTASISTTPISTTSISTDFLKTQVQGHNSAIIVSNLSMGTKIILTIYYMCLSLTRCTYQ